MRKLLQGSANLEFWETYNAQEIAPYLQQLDSRLANGGNESDTAKAEKSDSTKKAVAKKPATTQAKPKFKLNKTTPDAQLAEAKKLHPLLAMLQTTNQGLSVVGYASVRDTAAINRIIYGAVAKQVLPTDLKLLWSAKPADVGAKNIFELHALKVTTTNGRAPLEGDVVTDASDQFA